MNLIIFGIGIIIINFIVTLLMINRLSKSIIEYFKSADEIDNLFKEHICGIYDILAFNGLKRPERRK